MNEKKKENSRDPDQALLSRWKKRNSDGFLWSIQEQEDEIGRRILTWSKEIKGPLPRFNLYRILISE